MSIFLLNNIVVFLFIEAILLLLMSVSAISVVKVLKGWDFKETTSLQYALEKRNYLVNTIIYFTIVVKIVMFVFFIKSLDGLSPLVPGAMCTTGVVGASLYGNILLLFKIVLLFLLGIWIIVNRLDLLERTFPYIRAKYYLFNFIYVLVLVEFFLEIIYFMDIPLDVPVFCCSSVFKLDNLPFELTMYQFLVVFYILYVAIVVSAKREGYISSFFFNILFLFVSYYCVTYFFGTYVYEMPSHKCPYCMLQEQYHYVGYFIWISVFLGVFFGTAPYVVMSLVLKKYKHLFKYTIIFNTVFVLLCTYYVAIYYYGHGLLLE